MRDDDIKRDLWAAPRLSRQRSDVRECYCGTRYPNNAYIARHAGDQ